MGFMEQEITGKQEWYAIETNQGTWFVPKEVSGYFEGTISADEVEQDVYPQTIDTLSQYCEGEIISVETRIGYGARLSAPGYLDCTEWSVFDSKREAKEYIEENYPDETEDEDSEDEIETEDEENED